MDPEGVNLISRRDVIRNLAIAVGGSSLLGATGGSVALDALTPAAAPLASGKIRACIPN